MHTPTHTPMHTIFVIYIYTHNAMLTLTSVCNAISPYHSLISEGQLGIRPTNCDSMLNDICVRNILRGQSVKLCTRKTLIPSSTPPEGRVTQFIRAYWRRKRSEGNLEDVYKCFENGICFTQPVDHHCYSEVNESCITVSDVQENEMFSLELLVHPDIEYSSRTVTFALQIFQGSV